MNKVDTIAYQGKDYATVPARLKEFRQKHPRASINTEPRFFDDGSVMFQATIVQDRKDEYSPTATGTARYSKTEVDKPKAFEKLETISVGRALANIGFLNNGEIATTEEMIEFEEYKEDQWKLVVAEIANANGRQDLATILSKLNAEQKLAAAPLIKQRGQELRDGKVSTSATA